MKVSYKYPYVYGIDIHTPKKLMVNLVDRIHTYNDFYEERNGISTGFKKLDVLTNGFQSSNLILVGGVAGMGKTSFALSLIKNLAQEKNEVILFSLQLSAQQIIFRLISQKTNIDSEKLRLGSVSELELEQIKSKIKEFKKMSLKIIDYPFLTIPNIKEIVYGMVSPEPKVKIVVIDALELIASTGKDSVGKFLNKKELALITFQLKKLAKKLNIVIIATVDFDGKNIKNYYKRPHLSDLRKYAPIDKYADLILFLFRPEYYKIDEWDDEFQTSTAGQAEIIVAKNNYGKLDNIRVKFNHKSRLFEDFESAKTENK